MASIKEFKKEVNEVLSDIIEDCYVCQLKSDDKIASQVEKIIDEAINTFDGLIEKLNHKGVENKKEHFKKLRKELSTQESKMLAKLDKLRA